MLDNFGGLKAILEARPEQLRHVPGISPEQAELISCVLPIIRTWQRLTQQVPDALTNVRKAETFCKSLIAGSRVENFFVICLNAKCHVIGKRRISTGSVASVSAYPRLVLETALNYNAYSVMFCHNHPGGTCMPSTEDIGSTLQLQQMLGMVDIQVLDHLIIAGDQA